jgi:phage gpG-like protein
MPTKIEVTGLKEFQASLRAMDSALPRRLRLVLNDATELVLAWARPRMPRKSGRAVASLKARSSQRESRVALGGTKAPYAPWLDFGGQGRVHGRPPKRPFIKDGRYLYQGLKARRLDVTKAMADGVAELAREAGLEVT